MKNKHGFLLAEETLKIVIAVIAIGFLAYFLSALYFSKVNSDKLKFANNEIERMKENIDSLEEDQVLEQDLPNPKGWHLFSFTGDIKPNSCAGQNCLCICDKVSWDFSDLNRQEKKCDDKGACLIEPDLREVPVEIKIKGADDLVIILLEKTNGRILVTEKN